MTLSFRQFVELHKHPANYVYTIWQELGIDRNSLPDVIESGPIEMEDEGIIYNQAIWQIQKPIEDTDLYVRIKFVSSKSPNFERAYVRKPNGQLMPYQGEIDGKTHLISVQKLAEILGKGWTPALTQQATGG